MWDEKKFFEDFVRETDQIDPDEDFIKNLKTMKSDDVPVKHVPAWTKYGAAAAAVVLCILGGILVQNLNVIQNPTEDQLNNGTLHGQIEEHPHTGGTVILTLDTVTDYVKDEAAVIIDETGKSIDEAKREQLIHLLETAVSADYYPKEDETYHEYHCNDSLEFTLKVYDNGYFLIEESGLFYKGQ